MAIFIVWLQAHQARRDTVLLDLQVFEFGVEEVGDAALLLRILENVCPPVNQFVLFVLQLRLQTRIKLN